MVKLKRNVGNPVPEPPKVDELGGYVTMDKARELSGYSRPYLLSLMRQEKIRAVQIDRRTFLFERASLHRFVEQRRKQQKS